jgi:GR25 family glycosyltransferase involved in LPS biosynthesis
MKAFLIFVKDHLGSTTQAAKALASCKDTGWDVEFMEGVTPLTVDKYDKWSHCPGSRASNFFEQNEKKYKTKKSCFMNHVRVWEKCIELNKPVAFLEHDVGCVRDYIEEDFEDVLILNIESAMKQEVFNDIKDKGKWDLGIHEYMYSPLAYRHNVPDWRGFYMMPGTGSYAVTPKGAQKLLNACEKYGWEQSDFFINTANVTIQYIVPEYFTFKSKNLNMSHGF